MKNCALTVMLTLIFPALVGCEKNTEQPAAIDTKPTTSTPEVIVNAPIPPENIDLTFRQTGDLEYSPSNDMVNFKVEVINQGKTAVSSAGKLPVHLGIVIQGRDGTLQTEPANQNFMRIPFPSALEPGQHMEITGAFPAAPTLGGKVVLDAVQEQVSWLSGYGKPVLELGSFKRCQDAATSLCLADGSEVTTSN